MKRLAITILTMMIIGVIAFSGYKLYKYGEKAISEVEIILFNINIVLT